MLSLAETPGIFTAHHDASGRESGPALLQCSSRQLGVRPRMPPGPSSPVASASAVVNEVDVTIQSDLNRQPNQIALRDVHTEWSAIACDPTPDATARKSSTNSIELARSWAATTGFTPPAGHCRTCRTALLGAVLVNLAAISRDQGGHGKIRHEWHLPRRLVGHRS
jgi:hypothetical protein